MALNENIHIGDDTGRQGARPMIDRDIVKRAQDGDPEAFTWLVEQHYDLMHRFAYRWCGNVSDAEDIVQDACIKLARGLTSYRRDAAFTTWLYRLVINCARDWQRRQGRHERTSSEVLAMTTQAVVHEHHAEHQVLLEQVLRSLAQLPDGFKETVLLVHGEGLSHGEAATVLKVKESTVSWRLFEVRKHLQSFAAGGAEHE